MKSRFFHFKKYCSLGTRRKLWTTKPVHPAQLQFLAATHRTSQFQDVHFSWLSAAQFFFACANLWIGIIEKNINSSCPKWCFKSCFCLLFYKEKAQFIYSTCFLHQKHYSFCISSCSIHDVFCLFLRAPNLVFSGISSCTKSYSVCHCSCHMMFFVCVFCCAPYRVFLQFLARHFLPKIVLL